MKVQLLLPDFQKTPCPQPVSIEIKYQNQIQRLLRSLCFFAMTFCILLCNFEFLVLSFEFFNSAPRPWQKHESFGRKFSRHHQGNSSPAIALTISDNSNIHSTSPFCCSRGMNNCNPVGFVSFCIPSSAIPPFRNCIPNMVSQNQEKCNSIMSLSCRMWSLWAFWPS
jgi:hypothetical protein